MEGFDFPILANQDVVYLDNAATSLMPIQVQDAMAWYENSYRSNVARGIYLWAEQATAGYENARTTVAQALQAASDEIVFASGATAALNMVAGMLAQSLGARKKVLVTELEHHSNIVPWQLHFGHDNGILWAECDRRGEFDAAGVADLFAGNDIGVVAVTHASNVTGAIPDIEAVAAIAREAGALVVVDGAQYVPHALPNPRQIGADFYVFSGHKCNGPTGVGVLWGKAELLKDMAPVTGGGGMVVQVEQQRTSFVEPPHRFEAGTPPIAAAIGLGAALQSRLRLEESGQWRQAMERLDGLAQEARAALASMDGIELPANVAGGGRIPLIPFNVAGCHPHDVCQILGQEGVYVRGGHHCAQPLMKRLGLTACVRASLGLHTQAGDIDRLLGALEKAARKLR